MEPLVLDSWMCGDFVMVEEVWNQEKESATLKMWIVGRRPEVWKKNTTMTSLDSPNQSAIPVKGAWTFEEAREEFDLWLVDIKNESLEDNPERDIDAYVVEMLQMLYISDRVKEEVKEFPANELSFRKTALSYQSDIALIYKPV
jgi:hypothetical protein